MVVAMLNPMQFAIISVDDAIKIKNSIEMLINKKEIKFNTFREKLQKVGLYDFYTALDGLLFQNSQWQQIQQLNANEVVTRDEMRAELFR